MKYFLLLFSTILLLCLQKQVDSVCLAPNRIVTDVKTPVTTSASFLLLKTNPRSPQPTTITTTQATIPPTTTCETVTFMGWMRR